MIVYRYSTSLSPPAPCVKISARCPATGNHVADQPAQLDWGADRTVLPGALLSALAVVEDGRSAFQGFAGEIIELPLYLVELQIHDLAPLLVRVTRGEAESHTLRGRDVLNHYRIVLDGPALRLEIH